MEKWIGIYHNTPSPENFEGFLTSMWEQCSDGHPSVTCNIQSQKSVSGDPECRIDISNDANQSYQMDARPAAISEDDFDPGAEAASFANNIDVDLITDVPQELVPAIIDFWYTVCLDLDGKMDATESQELMDAEGGRAYLHGFLGGKGCAGPASKAAVWMFIFVALAAGFLSQ
jgi:hypothetical protein